MEERESEHKSVLVGLNELGEKRGPLWGKGRGINISPSPNGQISRSSAAMRHSRVLGAAKQQGIEGS